MRPIGRSLLPHEATVYKEEEKNRWGESTLVQEALLKHIRLELMSGTERDMRNEEVQITAVLYYDCTNSLPPGFVFREGQIIEAAEQRWRIKSIRPVYGKAALHHYEIGLM